VSSCSPEREELSGNGKSSVTKCVHHGLPRIHSTSERLSVCFERPEGFLARVVLRVTMGVPEPTRHRANLRRVDLSALLDIVIACWCRCLHCR